jgi:cytochrome c5
MGRTWVLAMTVAVGLALFSSGAWAGTACRASSFQTEMMAQACASGGQKAAAAAMKTFMKRVGKRRPDLTCNSCHTRLAPDYPLTADGLRLFRELGGT